jgi:glycosyltransferase involved in cell wall biosynthesis
MPKISKAILNRSIVVSSDVIEHIVNLESYLRSMAYYSKHAPFVLISTPDRSRVRGINHFGPPPNIAHVREWTADELHALLDDYGFTNLRTGYTINTNIHQDKSTILTISGNNNPSAKSIRHFAKPSVLAIYTSYNEDDIIRSSILNMLEQGIDVYVIDNLSTDKTLSVVKGLSKKYKGRVSFESFAGNRKNKYQWEKLLRRVDEVACSSEYDWIIHHDSDEIRTSPEESMTLKDIISHADHLGFNAIDFTVMDFRPIDNGYNPTVNPTDYFRYFEYGRRPGHFIQTKCWKNQRKSVGLWKAGGHDVEFPGKRVYPIKCILKHYPLRSTEQAVKKIFSDRNPRITTEEKTKGWHSQYVNYTKKDSFIWERNSLKKYHGVMTHQEDMVELISGIGILESDLSE